MDAAAPSDGAPAAGSGDPAAGPDARGAAGRAGPTPPGSLLADLQARGLVADRSEGLAERLAAGPLSLYCGFDPTADSLHVGHLLGLLTLRRFQLAGHRPLVLVGGATGRIGDPSGRSEERNLLDDETLAANVAAIRGQLEGFFDFGPGPSGAVLVDNSAWTAPLGLIAFLRDVGKHMTVNQMLARESVKVRLAGTSGLSFTEFSYQVLQAHDFAWLAAHEGCELQIGGSDQWGNITAGIDLTRKLHARVVHGLTWPLLTKADGTKFGKTAGGAVWLSAERTSPYRFHQFWMQTDDADVEGLLARFTLLGTDEVAAVAEAHRAAPERREAQRRLAREVTALVHGPAAAEAAEQAAALLFGTDLHTASPEVLAGLVGEVPTASMPSERLAAGVDAVEILVTSGLAASRSEGRRLLAQGAVRCNGEPLAEGRSVGAADAIGGRFLVLRRGKRTYALVTVG